MSPDSTSRNHSASLPLCVACGGRAWWDEEHSDCVVAGCITLRGGQHASCTPVVLVDVVEARLRVRRQLLPAAALTRLDKLEQLDARRASLLGGWVGGVVGLECRTQQHSTSHASTQHGVCACACLSRTSCAAACCSTSCCTSSVACCRSLVALPILLGSCRGVARCLGRDTCAAAQALWGQGLGVSCLACRPGADQ